MKRHELVIGNKYKALKDSGGYLKNDVLIFEEDDGSSCPYFRNTRTDEIDPAFLDRLIPIEHRFKVGDTVKTTPELWTAYENYDTNPVVDFSKAYKIKSIGSYHWNDQEEMVVHFNEENSPTGEDIGWIPEACFIHAEEEVPSITQVSKVLMSDGVEPKPGMWVCFEDKGDTVVHLVTQYANDVWEFDRDLSIGTYSPGPQMLKPSAFRQATNLEVANWCKKHDLFKHLAGKLDFLKGLWISWDGVFTGVLKKPRQITGIGPNKFVFEGMTAERCDHDDPEFSYTRLTFSDHKIDVTPEPKPEPEPMFSIGDYVYDYDNVIFDVDHKLEIVDTELQDGEWIYSCYDDTEEEGDWLREEHLKQWKEPKMKPVSSGMPDWVFPGVMFWEKDDHSAIRTVKEVLDGIFKSSIWNGSEERLTHSITWDRHDAMKFEPLPYEEAQKRWIEKYNVKEGDILKVIRKCPNYFLGWKSSWVAIMVVGNIGPYHEGQQSMGIEGKYYPYFCLEKVSEAPKQEGLTSEQMSAYGKGLLEQIQSGPIWTGCTTPSAKLHIYQPKIQDLLTVTPERVKFELKITKEKIINL